MKLEIMKVIIKKIFSGSITNKINKLKKPFNKSISYKSMKH